MTPNRVDPMLNLPQSKLDSIGNKTWLMWTYQMTGSSMDDRTRLLEAECQSVRFEHVMTSYMV